MVEQHQNHTINPFIENSNMNRIPWTCKPSFCYLLKYISLQLVTLKTMLSNIGHNIDHMDVQTKEKP